MKRRSFIKHTGLAGILAAGSAPAFAQAAPEVKWAHGCELAEEPRHDLGGAELVSKRCASATNNKFQIQVFAAGEIVPGLQVLDAVQNRRCNLPHAPYYFSARIRRSLSPAPFRSG